MSKIGSLNEILNELTPEEREERIQLMERQRTVIHPKTIIDDVHRFREKMGLKTSDPDELQELYSTLLGCWAMARSTRQHPDATEEELDLMDRAFECLEAEWSKRFVMMAMGPLYPFNKDNIEVVEKDDFEGDEE